MEKYYEKTFKITDYSNEFRFKKIKPTKLLSLATLFNEDNSLEANEQIFDFALLHTEVNLGGQWTQVLTIFQKEGYVYWPMNIEDNLRAINEIITEFIREVLNKVFLKSNESQK